MRSIDENAIQAQTDNQYLDTFIRNYVGYLTDNLDSRIIITVSNKKMGNAKVMAAKLEKEVKEYLVQKKMLLLK